MTSRWQDVGGGTGEAYAERFRQRAARGFGFGLDAAHLPLPEAPFTLEDYDAWCAAAGLEFVARHPAWDEPAGVQAPGGYAVSVHRR